ncbi:hypothetical protein VOLCADRAFT_40167, partial [Volvox carteri f. nagariensis]
LLGLTHCSETLVGDQFVRGVSGGERKRLTAAEMLMWPGVILTRKVYSFLGGTDSATLFTVIRWLSQAAKALQLTIVASLLQPPPEVFGLFDDVVLLTEGRVLYHGPVKAVVEHFRSVGLDCPDRKDVPSFLLEITTPTGQREFAVADVYHRQRRHVEPRPVAQAAAKVGLVCVDCRTAPLQPSGPPAAPLVPLSNRFALRPLEAVAAATRRQMMLVSRDKVLLKGRIMQVIVLGLLTGSLFYNQVGDGGVSMVASRTIFGACFMSTLFMSFGSFPQLPVTMELKKVWFKHRSAAFYPAYAQGLAMALSQLPLSTIESVIFSLIMYFMVNFYRYDTFHSMYVRRVFVARVPGVSCICRNMVVANAAVGFVFVLLILTSGFAIVHNSIPPWAIWGYWISPHAYALRSLVINEMVSPKWQNVPAPPGMQPGLSLGDAALLSFDFYLERKWIWIGVGFLLGSFLLLTYTSIISLAHQQPEVPQAQVRTRVCLPRDRYVTEIYTHTYIHTYIHTYGGGEGRGEEMGVGGQSSSQISGDVSIVRSSPPSPSLTRTDFIDISSSLPFTPITLVFQDLNAVLPVAARERLQLLSGITGFNEPGVLLALMGGSGAGKTTLMDVIAGRKTIGEISGTITVNGHRADPRAWSRVMGYVEQFDIHSPGQTVVEALQFSARLRLPKSCSNSQVKSYVEEVLEIVDLLPLMSSLVGSPGVSGLSVEARKRLTIAVELVANPSCIFLDEPTSGLDARAAAIVMRAVRNIARNGRTVMVTIHQPSIEIFEAFDQLLLIQRGGLTTYFGPLGLHSADLISYFMAVPGTPALPSGFNPATWMLEVTGGSMATVLNRVDVNWPELYDKSELAAKVRRPERAGRGFVVGSRYAMPFGVQVRVLLQKFNLAYWRAPGYNFMRVGMTLATSFIYAAVYWGEGRVPDPAGIANVQNVMGIMFSSSNFLGMVNLMSVLPVVGYERVVFYRERGASMYDPFAYGAAIALVEMPYLLIQALTFVPIIYFMIGFDTAPEQFFYYIIVFFETIAFYTIFGQTLVYITPAQAIAQVVGGGFNFLFNVFNGFIITYPDMPSGWRWMNRAVPPTWILYGLGISQLGN